MVDLITDFNFESEIKDRKKIREIETTLLLSLNKIRDCETDVNCVTDEEYNNLREYLTLMSKNISLLKNVDAYKNFSVLRDTEDFENIQETLSELDSIPFFKAIQGLPVRVTFIDGELSSVKILSRSYKDLDIEAFFSTYIPLTVPQQCLEMSYVMNDYSEVAINGVLAIPLDEVDTLSSIIDIEDSYRGLFPLITMDTDLDDNIIDSIHFIAYSIDIQGKPIGDWEDMQGFLENEGYLIPETVILKNDRPLNLLLNEAKPLFKDTTYSTDGFIAIGRDLQYIYCPSDTTTYLAKVEDITWGNNGLSLYPELHIKLVDEDYSLVLPIYTLSLLLVLSINVGTLVNLKKTGKNQYLLVLDTGEMFVIQ